MSNNNSQQRISRLKACLSRATLIIAAALCASCGSNAAETNSEGKKGNADGGIGTNFRDIQKSGPSLAGSAGTGSATKIDQLPAAALSAWESNARANCQLIKDRFVSRKFSPYSAANPGDMTNKFLPADLNGDGKTDFAIVTNDLGCSQRDFVLMTEFILSSPAGYRVYEGFSGKQGIVGVQRCGTRDVMILNSGSAWGWKDGKVSHLGKANALDCSSASADTSSSATAAAKVATLPVRAGYYAVSPDSCAVANRDFTGVVITGSSLEFNDPPMGFGFVRIVRKNDQEFVVTESTGESEDDIQEVTKYRIVDASRFIRTLSSDGGKTFPQSEAATYQFCSSAAPSGWEEGFTP